MSALAISDPTDLYTSIRLIVGYSNRQYNNPDQAEIRQAAINRRIYNLVTEALRRRAVIMQPQIHIKYLQAIEKAFVGHENEIYSGFNASIFRTSDGLTHNSEYGTLLVARPECYSFMTD